MNTVVPTVDKASRAKIILALAIPAMLENFFQTIVGFVDTLFVAKLGLAEVAAVGVTNAILQVYFALFMALGVGASSLLARSIGEMDVEKARRITKQSVWLAVLAGVICGAVTLFFAESLLQLMGADQEVLQKGALYFRIVAIPSVLLSLTFVLGSILRATGDTKSPMKVSLWINIIHVALDYVLIFGMFFIPALGISGAAWATVIVRLIGVIALFGYIRKSKWGIGKTIFTPVAADMNITSSLIRLATPAAIERLIMRLGQVLYFGIILVLGTKTYAAHQIAGNIEIFSYMPGYGLAAAATTLVGQRIGAGLKSEAYRFGVETAWIGAAFMTFVGIIMFFAAPWASRFFTDDTGVISQVVTALRIDAFAQPALAIGLILTGALQGLGDTKTPMVATAIGMWAIRVAGVYLTVEILGMGLAGVWLTIAVDLYVRAGYLFYQFRKKGYHQQATSKSLTA